MGISFNAAALLNGNGIDVSSVVNTILSRQSGPLQLWGQQQTALATQAGLLQGINNNLTSLATAVSALASPTGPLTAIAASSSQPAILGGTAQPGALAGTHQIVVSNLASTGTVYTNPIASGTTSILNGAPSGDIQLQVGGVAGVTRDIVITPGSNDTLITLAAYINQQNWGATATVVSDASGARLAISSQASGTPGALAITNNDTILSFNPPFGGANASLSIDGVPFSSTSNTVVGALSGVTLNLASADPLTTVLLTVGPDTGQITQAINDFVSAYNAVSGNINQQFTVSQTSNTEGPLAADSALRSLQSSLLADVTYSIVGNNGVVNLASLGVNLNNDGTLTVDDSQLSDTLATNPAAFQNFFQSASPAGFANNFHLDLSHLTDPTQGILNLDIAENKTQQQGLTDEINNLQDRLAAQQQALTLVYAQVNATLEAYPILLQEIMAQLGVTPTSSSTSNSSPTTGASSTF